MENQTLPATIISTANAEHYLWGGTGGTESEGWYLLRNPSLIEERMPPSAKETRHFHTHSRQFFYVLEGELTIEIDHRELTLHAGQGIEVAPAQRHQVMNRTAKDLRILVLSHPPSHGDRTESA